MRLLLALTIFAAVVMWYALWGRNWLKGKSWMEWYYGSALGQWIELKLFKNSETILFARLKILSGLLLTLLTSVGTIDITPIMPFVPDDWEPYVRGAFNLIPLLLTVVGWADESLRNKTTLPIEVVALPEAEKAKPEIAAAVEKLQEVKVEAIVKVAEAKAQENV